MAGLEELRKKLTPLFDVEKGLGLGSSTLDPSDSYTGEVVIGNWEWPNGLMNDDLMLIIGNGSRISWRSWPRRYVEQ
ncbi:putative mitogen-activated protein kinase kinase [Rosa chinensis]|uniref:Putative mitogen-activated protein kinase kinase n=1 Tax=Rosa chinensis TaxID=74649 RepID=A0A2P6RV49_ROSCH|nr:putative mitogen-activated protein kinase kinase [Rosa chinensis]